MGVYIKGMEMPKNCSECKMFNASHAIGLFAPLGWCRVNGKEIFHLSKKADNCPLVNIPPHGRLIDADALIKEIDKQENAMYEHGHEFSFSFESGGDVCTAWYNVEMMVEDAPTIIPAEEGE